MGVLRDARRDALQRERACLFVGRRAMAVPPRASAARRAERPSIRPGADQTPRPGHARPEYPTSAPGSGATLRTAFDDRRPIVA